MNKTSIIAAAAAVFAAGTFISAAHADGTIKCAGGNACKGQSACKTASAEKGQNACKGQGFVMTGSSVECTVLQQK